MAPSQDTYYRVVGGIVDDDALEKNGLRLNDHLICVTKTVREVCGWIPTLLRDGFLRDKKATILTIDAAASAEAGVPLEEESDPFVSDATHTPNSCTLVAKGHKVIPGAAVWVHKVIDISQVKEAPDFNPGRVCRRNPGSAPNSVTLSQLYPDGIDENEGLYDFVSEEDENKPLPVVTLGPKKLAALQTLLGDMTAVEAFNQFAEPAQIKLVKRYTQLLKNNKLPFPENVVVTKGETLVDGNHRVVAAVKIGVSLPAVDLNDLEATKQNPGPSMKKTFKITVPGGARVYVVDGTAVRRRHTDWIGGSHYYADRYVPEGEIWIERMKNPAEERYLLAHEMTERLLQKYKKFSYKRGHAEATIVENALRRGKKPSAVFLAFIAKHWSDVPEKQRQAAFNLACAYRSY